MAGVCLVLTGHSHARPAICLDLKTKIACIMKITFVLQPVPTVLVEVLDMFGNMALERLVAKQGDGRAFNSGMLGSSQRLNLK